jgi:hypothetical protein
LNPSFKSSQPHCTSCARSGSAGQVEVAPHTEHVEMARQRNLAGWLRAALCTKPEILFSVRPF